MVYPGIPEGGLHMNGAFPEAGVVISMNVCELTRELGLRKPGAALSL